MFFSFVFFQKLEGRGCKEEGREGKKGLGRVYPGDHQNKPTVSASCALFGDSSFHPRYTNYPPLSYFYLTFLPPPFTYTLYIVKGSV